MAVKIIADENMPLVRELFGRYGEVVCLPGRSICAQHLGDADVLLVRSVTPVNKALLDGSAVRFVGSATIGVDHIDLVYLQKRGIVFSNAPGCNANAVVDYVFSALCALQVQWQWFFAGHRTVGIIGCGNVGGRLHRKLKALGITVRCYDPFLTASQNPDLTDLDAVLACDVVSMHTPYTVDGLYPTHHMLSARELALLKPGAILINAGRGPAVDNSALQQWLERGGDLRVVLDVWEAEPNVAPALLDLVALATPHIAGYSVQGKEGGTTMVRDAFLRWQGRDIPPGAVELASSLLQASDFSQAVLAAYDIREDDRRMREALSTPVPSAAESFDRLRKNYPHRNEFSCYQVQTTERPELARQLALIGFRVSE